MKKWRIYMKFNTAMIQLYRLNDYDPYSVDKLLVLSWQVI